VKPGLIASGIVSAWTWAATLLQSSTVAYEYGVAGPFWVKEAFLTVVALYLYSFTSPTLWATILFPSQYLPSHGKHMLI